MVLKIITDDLFYVKSSFLFFLLTENINYFAEIQLIKKFLFFL